MFQVSANCVAEPLFMPGFETGTKYMLVLASLFSCLKCRPGIYRGRTPDPSEAERTPDSREGRYLALGGFRRRRLSVMPNRPRRTLSPWCLEVPLTQKPAWLRRPVSFKSVSRLSGLAYVTPVSHRLCRVSYLALLPCGNSRSSNELVEPRRFELLTSALQKRRSPN
jgi:hypothetical protein